MNRLTSGQQKITFHTSTAKVYFESGRQVSGAGNGWATSLYNGSGDRFVLMANPDGLYFLKYSPEGERTEIWHILA